MRTIKIDEYLIIDAYSGKRRWISRYPNRRGVYDVIVRVRGTIVLPDALPVIELGEIAIPEMEVMAEAKMG